MFLTTFNSLKCKTIHIEYVTTLNLDYIQNRILLIGVRRPSGTALPGGLTLHRRWWTQQEEEKRRGLRERRPLEAVMARRSLDRFAGMGRSGRRLAWLLLLLALALIIQHVHALHKSQVCKGGSDILLLLHFAQLSSSSNNNRSSCSFFRLSFSSHLILLKITSLLDCSLSLPVGLLRIRDY
jgi:hypothetical protein